MLAFFQSTDRRIFVAGLDSNRSRLPFITRSIIAVDHCHWSFIAIDHGLSLEIGNIAEPFRHIGVHHKASR
jgi:hypothetical protein